MTEISETAIEHCGILSRIMGVFPGKDTRRQPSKVVVKTAGKVYGEMGGRGKEGMQCEAWCLVSLGDGMMLLSFWLTTTRTHVALCLRWALTVWRQHSVTTITALMVCQSHERPAAPSIVVNFLRRLTDRYY